MVKKGKSYVVELVHGLYYKNPKVVKLVHGLHLESPRVMKLEVGLHHGCLGDDHGCPGVVKLEVGLHRGGYIREHEVFRGGEASDGASPPKVREGEVHDGTSPWEFQGV